MPLHQKITAGVKALVSIDTRNADYSATGRDGLLWLRAGYYTMYVFSYPTGLGAYAEQSGKMMEVLPEGFLDFWVWSASKMRHTFIDVPPNPTPDPTH